jgi:hypothetical protein
MRWIMKKIICIFAFILILTFNSFSGLKSHLAGVGFQIASHPERFLTDIQNDVENLSSIQTEKRFTLQTNILWDLVTVLNLNLKCNILRQTRSMPQINLNFSLWYQGVVKFSSDFNTKIFGISPSIIFSKSIEYDLNFLAGIKYSIADVEIKLKKNEFGEVDDGNIDFNLDEIDELSCNLYELSPFVGINYLKSENKQILFVIGYHIENKIIYSKIHFVKTRYNWGFSLFVIRFCVADNEKRATNDE